MRRWLLLLLVAAPALIHGQAPDSKTATFEVASVKPNKSDSSRSNLDLQPGARFVATNVPLIGLIRMAYGGGLTPSRMVGAPDWLGEKFDIVAKADGDLTPERLAPLLRSLLADRFKLATHTETRATRLFVLVSAHRSASGLRPASEKCADHAAEGCRMLNAPGTLRARSIPIEALTRLMIGWLDDHPPVRDETGLTGNFDIDLRWTPDRPPQVPLDAPPEIGQAVATIDPNGPSLFTAVQEQLGLKLEPRTESADVLVIDHIEHPTPD